MAIKRAKVQPPRRTYVEPEPFIRADPLRAQELIARAWKALSKAPARPRSTRPDVPWQTVTHGHGNQCVCEVCFPKRLAGQLGGGYREPGEDAEEIAGA